MLVPTVSKGCRLNSNFNGWCNGIHSAPPGRSQFFLEQWASSGYVRGTGLTTKGETIALYDWMLWMLLLNQIWQVKLILPYIVHQINTISSFYYNYLYLVPKFQRLTPCVCVFLWPMIWRSFVGCQLRLKMTQTLQTNSLVYGIVAGQSIPRPHTTSPQFFFCKLRKGSPLISGKSRLVNYCDLG